MYTPSPGTDRFQSATNTHGVVLLQPSINRDDIPDAESPYFMTNSATERGAAGGHGQALLGGERQDVLAILGTNTGFGGSLWLTCERGQASTGGTTQSGAIFNGGLMTASRVTASSSPNNLPSWTRHGGSNAGFVDTPAYSTARA